MKKVLLGLLALSATLMAESLENTGSSADQSIQINTKAYVIDSGLIITTDENGTSSIQNIELDHGRILATKEASSTVKKDIFIKKSNSQAFPNETTLNIALNSEDNFLKNGDSTIAHTLTATPDATGTAISLSGDSKEAIGNFEVGAGKSSVKVTLQSAIASGALTNGNFADGDYTNTSTLKVKISKIPSATSTSR
ncbi:hypothetical protein [uncultured Cetobacterium sp.]|uniref:hypothetical protein n=1 Tax=uncultured Cetobacterium sp. TaxID=527638 RepID=UPI0026386A36|nr:hypothetical protein [uncultured Cetobacterium sp.]